MSEIKKYVQDLRSKSLKDRGSALDWINKHAKLVDCTVAIPALIECLKDDHLSIRHMARKVLIELGKPTLPHLLEAMKCNNHHAKFQGGIIIKALAEKGIDCSVAVPTLKEALKDESEYVQLAAQLALKEIYAKQMCARPEKDKKFPEKNPPEKTPHKDRSKV
ncbi:MAG: hypothetical protein QXS93_00965 [Candidatus Micrarchaeia archaeon]